MDAFLDALDPDPLVAYERWLDEAVAAGLWEPDAAALATATPDGAPSVRMVLLRRRDERGVCFFTNRESRKGGELAVNPRAALATHWGPPLERQVRLEGTVERSTDAESLAYFRTRPLASRLGAWASPQSRPLADRDELEARLAEVRARFADDDDPAAAAVLGRLPARAGRGRALAGPARPAPRPRRYERDGTGDGLGRAVGEGSPRLPCPSTPGATGTAPTGSGRRERALV